MIFGLFLFSFSDNIALLHLIFVHAMSQIFGRLFQFPLAHVIPNVGSITRKGASVLWETRGIFVMGGLHATRSRGVTSRPRGGPTLPAWVDFSAKRLKYTRAGKCHRFFI